MSVANATVLATDSFTRANAPNLGANWTAMGDNGYEIISNQAVPLGFGNQCYDAYTAIAAFPPDQYAQGKITVVGTTFDTGMGPAVRMSGIAGVNLAACYRISANHGAANNIKLTRVKLGGNFLDLATVTSAWTDGDTWRLEIQGQTLKMFKNDVAVGVATGYVDRDLLDGYPGMSLSASITSGNVDDFECGGFNGSFRNDVIHQDFPKFIMRPIITQGRLV